MVSRRNLFSLTLMMLVLLCLFLVPQIIREYGNPYDVNEYANNSSINSSNIYKSVVYNSFPDNVTDNGFCVFVGKKGSDLEAQVEQWCMYTKRTLVVVNKLSDFYVNKNIKPELIMLDSSSLTYAEDINTLQDISTVGINIVFCNLPDVSVIKSNQKLQEFLGINNVKSEKVKLSGVKLFSGFILGGQIIYEAKTDEEKQNMQDLNLDMPWYQTFDRSKVYMTGLLDSDSEIKDSTELPSIIWRTSTGNGFVFAVNGDYLSTGMASGLLDGIVSDIGAYTIYPVINAQTVSVINYPGLSSENSDIMHELYSRSQKSVVDDILWPQLTAIAENNDIKYTCMMMSQWDYSNKAEPDKKIFTYFLKQLKEQKSEAALSLQAQSNISITDKINWDNDFYSSMDSKYIFTSAYIMKNQLSAGIFSNSLLSNINTILTDYDEKKPVVSFYSNDITSQQIINDGYTHTYTDNLLLHCMETALGYSSISIDMNRVLWPENDDDRWEKLSEKLSGNIETYWKPFNKFKSVTLSEADKRIRNFLSLNYNSSIKDDEITVDFSNSFDDVWFVLRTHNQTIDYMENGDYEKLEDDAYLIHTTKSQVIIKLKSEAGVTPYYYLDRE